MPIDEKKKIEELKSEIKHVGDVVVWSEMDLKLAIEVAASSIKKDLMPLDRIETYIRLDNTYIAGLSQDFKAFVPLIREDLKAISESTISSSSSIKENIEEANANSLSKMESLNNKNLIAEAVPQNGDLGGVNAIGGLFPVTLIKKLELVLDATAKFLKGWTNPITVGVALALPIIGGLAIIFGTVYFVISRIADSIDHLVDIVGNFLNGILEHGLTGLLFGSGGLKGFIFGSDESSEQNVSNEGATNIVSAIEESRDLLNSSLSGLAMTAEQISDSNSAILARLNAASYVLRNILLASSLAFERITGLKNLISGLPKSEETKSQSENDTIGYDSRFQNDLMSILNSTISVKVENLPNSNEEKEKPAEVFSRAIKPITENQDALLRSLESGLRKLSENVLSLRDAEDNRNVSLMSKPTDSTNSRISDDYEGYLLEATRDILDEVKKIYISFDEYKSVWLSVNKEDKQENTGSTPPESSGN